MSSIGASRSGSTQPRLIAVLWAVVAMATIGLLTIGLYWTTPAMMIAWLYAFLIFSGLSAGSLGLLMLGHVLGDEWLTPIRDELEPAAWTLPFIALVAVPLALNLDALYPWARGKGLEHVPSGRLFFLEPEFFVVRAIMYLAIWIVLAWAIARTGEHRGVSAFGLALLAPTASLAAIDWIMSRDPYWWSSLFGFAFASSQLTAALAAAFLVTFVREGHPEPERMVSLERALLTLALLTLWVWFSQFLIVWMANIPEEVAWYHVRAQGSGLTLIGIAIAALILAILILIPSHARRWRLLTAAFLIVVQYLAHVAWLIRYPAPQAGLTWMDIIVLLGIAAVWGLWFIAGLRRHSQLAVQASN